MGTVTIPLEVYLNLSELQKEFSKNKEVVYLEIDKFGFGANCYITKEELTSKMINDLESHKKDLSDKRFENEMLKSQLQSSIDSFIELDKMSIFGFIKRKISQSLWIS